MAGGIRAAFIVLAVPLALGASPTVAWAGADKGKDADQQILATRTASPGDLVVFAVPDTPQGAGYALELSDGARLAQGQDTTPQPGVLDDFRMPDLGFAPLKLRLLLEVLNPDGSGWKQKASLQYLPRSGSGVPTPPPVDLGGAPPAAAVHDSGPALPTVPKVNVGGLVPGRAADPPRHSKKGPARQRHTAPAGASKKEAPAMDSRAGRSVRRLRALRELSDRHRRPSSDAGRLLNEPRSRLDTTGSIPAHHPAQPKDTRVDLSRESYPGVGWTVAWRFLAGAIALLLLLTVGVGGVVRQRRRQRQELDDALRHVLSAEDRVGV